MFGCLCLSENGISVITHLKTDVCRILKQRWSYSLRGSNQRFVGFGILEEFVQQTLVVGSVSENLGELNVLTHNR